MTEGEEANFYLAAGNLISLWDWIYATPESYENLSTESWVLYTNPLLGLTYQTEQGSTVRIFSGMHMQKEK